MPNGSPYELDKDDKRALLVRSRVTMTGLPLAYLNRVGGQDELVFDGSSFIMHPDGERVVQFPDWDEKLMLTEWKREADGWRCATRESHQLDPFPEDVYRAMIVGLARLCDSQRLPRRDPRPVGRDRQRPVGGDRGRCAGAGQGVGRDAPVEIHVARKASTMRGSAPGCSDVVMTSFRSRPEWPLSTRRWPKRSKDTKPGLAEENIQARLRMVALMALSNKFGPMLLTTGNKSEMSVGYATLYGDMSGGYNVLKDAYKTTVFALSRWRNRNKPEGALGPDGPVMPANVITKPPTAELRPGQKDEDSLPPYSDLDRILEALIDKEMSVREVGERHGRAGRTWWRRWSSWCFEPSTSVGRRLRA